MVFKDESIIKRLGELTQLQICLEIVVLGNDQFRLETKTFSKIHEKNSVTVYRDGLDIQYPQSERDGQYGQIYIQPLRLVVSYILPSEAS